MVNVQNVSEFPCQVLNRDVWSNGAIKELIKENFLFLQVGAAASVVSWIGRSTGISWNLVLGHRCTWTARKASAT